MAKTDNQLFEYYDLTFAPFVSRRWEAYLAMKKGRIERERGMKRARDM
jgi:hypothetical protein